MGMVQMNRALPRLNSFEWVSLPVVVQNTSIARKMEPSLIIIDAICKFAARKGRVTSNYFFHPKNFFPIKMQKGHLFSFTVIFTYSVLENELFALINAKRMAKGLEKHLANRKTNFRLVSVGTPQVSSVGQTVSFSNLQDELCLNFITPLSYRPKSYAKRRKIDQHQLYRLFQRRCSLCFGVDISSLRRHFYQIRVIDDYWRYIQLEHSSKSSYFTNKQYLNGMIGPLYLKGNIQPILSILALGEIMHISQRQSGGRGCYQLRPTKFPL